MIARLFLCLQPAWQFVCSRCGSLCLQPAWQFVSAAGMAVCDTLGLLIACFVPIQVLCLLTEEKRQQNCQDWRRDRRWASLANSYRITKSEWISTVTIKPLRMTGTSAAQIKNFTLPSSSESANGKCWLSESQDELLFRTPAAQITLLKEWRHKRNVQTCDWSSEMGFGRPKYSEGNYHLFLTWISCHCIQGVTKGTDQTSGGCSLR